jgi:hypothetical protein
MIFLDSGVLTASILRCSMRFSSLRPTEPAGHHGKPSWQENTAAPSKVQGVDNAVVSGAEKVDRGQHSEMPTITQSWISSVPVP